MYGPCEPADSVHWWSLWLRFQGDLSRCVLGNSLLVVFMKHQKRLAI